MILERESIDANRTGGAAAGAGVQSVSRRPLLGESGWFPRGDRDFEDVVAFQPDGKSWVRPHSAKDLATVRAALAAEYAHMKKNDAPGVKNVSSAEKNCQKFSLFSGRCA